MKRKSLLIIAVMLIFTLVIPAQGFAANMDKELENAIKIAKSKFAVPEDYIFSSSISTSGTKKVYYLNWRSPDTTNSTRINVSVDENGMILNYNKYTPYDYTRTKKLPTLSRQEAKAKADAHIEKIAPGLLRELEYIESTSSSIQETSYYFRYYRVANGVPFYNDGVYIAVNRDNGDLQDYSRSWTDGLKFPSAANPITVKEAEAAYVKSLGLRLIYRFSENDGAIKAFPVYVPVYDNNNYAIDAMTGEVRRLSGNYYVTFADDAGMVSFNQKAAVAEAAGEIRLSPEELEAVAEAGKLISKEEAEKVARAAKFLDLSDEFKVDYFYLGTNWPDKNDYSWQLQFTRPADDETGYITYISVTVNAKTGEITSFYISTPDAGSLKPKKDITVAKAEADAFLKEYYPEYFKQLEYNKQDDENRIYANDTRFYLSYSRLVDKVPFPDNGVSITYDNLTGEITSFNLNWFNSISFPGVDNAIGLEAAAGSLFKNVGLKLEYKIESEEKAQDTYVANQAGNVKAVLVYSLDANKPLYIDAISGALLNYNGTEYKEPEKIDYTDIKGHFAEKQIMVLADNGIFLEGKEFKPNDSITQLDFMTLLSKTLNYYGPDITPKSTGKEVDDLYAFLQREGIVRDGEKQPAQTVTREEAVKYIIRALKYDKVADIGSIFIVEFKDKASISPELTGYVAIASGLGIVKGDGTNFSPARKVTRGETAVMIYNYLQS